MAKKEAEERNLEVAFNHLREAAEILGFSVVGIKSENTRTGKSSRLIILGKLKIINKIVKALGAEEDKE